MNPTFDSTAAINRAEKAGTITAVTRLASVDTSSAPLPAGTPTHGELALATAYKPALGLPPYFIKHTRAAMGITLAMATATVVLPFVFSPSVGLISVVSFTATAAILGGYHWIFRKWGPSSISEERFILAKAELQASADDHQKPMTLLDTLGLLGIMTIDGALSGTALMSMFENLFTPRLAMVAAVGWGIAATALLFKLITSAAEERACNDRRESIRNLSRSSDPGDQAHAQAMKLAVGSKLGNDYSLSANKKSSRVALVLSVLVLAGSTFFLRAHHDAGGSSPAPVQQPVKFQKT